MKIRILNPGKKVSDVLREKSKLEKKAKKDNKKSESVKRNGKN